MSAWRCSPCGISWPGEPDTRIRPPLSPAYSVCPQCLERCDRIGNEDGIDRDTALILKLHLEFQRYYEKRPMPDVRSEAA